MDRAPPSHAQAIFAFSVIYLKSIQETNLESQALFSFFYLHNVLRKKSFTDCNGFFQKNPSFSNRRQRNQNKSVAENPKLWYNLCCVIIVFFKTRPSILSLRRLLFSGKKSGFQQVFNRVFHQNPEFSTIGGFSTWIHFPRCSILLKNAARQ